MQLINQCKAWKREPAAQVKSEEKSERKLGRKERFRNIEDKKLRNQIKNKTQQKNSY